ncbi:L-alanine-DL-glutamate epimerase-like enolase superfamily enzyme [Hymenobacter chitinivorans DSM 11115]|uniref:L-alanine-DL-glutamate epimerase-like enolase superfamily enzyme n=2 Tax=Hymenobacter chitinivorans TaxID=89969 RepID=A0A2M9BMN6_9BACT|nr:L-alanine-DL-glutamate epimerase-like enolase superfamily enzyme [Hymenobacter chitinivorans DSM 11115]
MAAHELPLRFTWKISRNASVTKTNLLVRVGEGTTAGWGEAAPNVRYNETPEKLTAEFEALVAAGLGQYIHLPELEEFLAAHAPSHALRFAVESAFVHREAALRGQSVAAWLGVPAPSRPAATAFTLPIMEPGAVAEFVRAQGMSRFGQLKIKVNQDSGFELLRALTQALPGREVLIDGNEAWTDADSLLRFLEQAQTLPGLRVRLLEQPLPAHCPDDYRYLRGRAPWPVFADESVTDGADFRSIAQQFHGVNMKLMKAGGYLNGIRLLQQTRAHGLQTMLGCMVETSLGIWSALQISHLADVCDLDGFLILRDEPFGLVREAEGLLTPLPVCWKTLRPVVS